MVFQTGTLEAVIFKLVTLVLTVPHVVLNETKPCLHASLSSYFRSSTGNVCYPFSPKGVGRLTWLLIGTGVMLHLCEAWALRRGIGFWAGTCRKP